MTTLVTCKTCNTQAFATSSASNHWCSKCKHITHLTTRVQLSTDLLVRKLVPNIIKDHNTLKSPYDGSLNYDQNPTTAGVPGSNRSNKRALLCGVTYNSKKYMLRGTVNDVINMKKFLIETFGFPDGCIRVLTGN